MKKNIILLGTLIISSIAYSQVGINTDQPKATLDIKASPTSTTKIDGLIAPRLTGNELQAKDALYEDDQDATIIYATAPVTTATDKTFNVTSIGYYYFDKTQGTAGRWMKIANPVAAATYQEPWNIQGTTNPSTANTDAIYQNNTVAIKKQTGITGADLDVLGAIRGGNANTTATVGENSIAVGNNTIASGANSVAFGKDNIAGSQYSAAFGVNNQLTIPSSSTVGAYATFVNGEANQVTQVLSFVNGYGNKLLGNDNTGTNFVSGSNNTLSGSPSWGAVIGKSNTLSANHAVIFGSSNNANNIAQFSLTSGESNIVTGKYGFVSGYKNQVAGTGAFASGQNLITSNNNEIALGNYNLNFTNSYFTIGNGTSSGKSNVIAVTAEQTNATTLLNAWVAIGSNTATPTRADNTIKLRVYGGIQTASSTYADYVFEDYFTGNSTIKPEYKFNSLYSVEKYVKENHHLPGVTSIKNLDKTADGYSFDLTSLSTQTLEKVEELYLHTIEQQKQIDELKEIVKIQQKQINQLLSK